MRTNIVLEDKLVKEVFKHCNTKTKKELINIALEEFVASHRTELTHNIKHGIKPEKI